MLPPVSGWGRIAVMKADDPVWALREALHGAGYVADEETATALHLASVLEKPLLVEGPAGVGKTEIAKMLAKVEGTEFIRLQCYEGLDAHHALYEWNYQRQLLQIRLDERSGKSVEASEATLFGEDFLLARPLLRAIKAPHPVVLLIDELDRADEEFEAFLLELLSDWQITIPEIGTITARSRPWVILTSNRTRELSDAIRRRSLYLWIDFPGFEKELAIVRRQAPEVDDSLAREICRFMEVIRKEDWEKTPGVAETLDWARALAALHRDHLDPEWVERTLGIVFKDWHDIRRARPALARFFEAVGVRSRILPTSSGEEPQP